MTTPSHQPEPTPATIPATPTVGPSSAASGDLTPVQQKRETRRSFIKWLAGMGAGLGGIAWIRSRELENGIPWPLRRIHQANEWFGRQLFSATRRVREFPASRAGEPRSNGWHGWVEGIGSRFAAIRLIVPGLAERSVNLEQLIGGLPRVEETTELKCIEGWSQIVTWGGVRFADAMTRLGISVDSFPFVSLATANENYYVGLDAPSAFHPQTLLCDRMNGEPLPESHGGPLRLVIPVKYGIKNIKWLGQIRFQSTIPADYWAERGYDWYSGL